MPHRPSAAFAARAAHRAPGAPVTPADRPAACWQPPTNGRWQRLLALAALACGLLAAPAAWAQLTVNQILFPSNIGRALPATVMVDITHTGSAGGQVTLDLPPELAVDTLPAASGCGTGSTASSVVCTVPADVAGTRGMLSFDVRGARLGSFNLAAASPGSSASNTGTVRESGNVTLAHTRLPNDAVVAVGQPLQFSIGPRITGGDALPDGAVLSFSWQLPVGFTVGSIVAGSASCSSVSSANSTRSLSCSIGGPLSLLQVNGITVTVSGTHAGPGNVAAVGSVLAQPSAYFDQDGNDNIVTLAYTVGAGQADLEARGSFVTTPVAASSPQTLTLVLRNLGPSSVPAGGRISTTIPPGFTVGSLPAGCSGPATGSALLSAATLSCSAGALDINTSQNFVVPLTMPGTAGSGNFPLTTQTPAGYDDPAAGNNLLNLPWQTVVASGPPTQVTLLVESSSTGTPGSWVSGTATPPVVDATMDTMYWRMRITAGTGQPSIGTLVLTQQIPGVLDVSSPGAPAPGYRTPAITVSSNAPGACPATVAAGSDLLTCTFGSVAAGSSIDVTVTVTRPFFSSAQHTSTATLSSPDAVLTGTTVGSAALNTFPRTDLYANSISIAPSTPRVGQAVQFTLVAQNLGPDQNEIGEFRMLQDLNTSTAGSSVAYGDLAASGIGLSCDFFATALPGEPGIPAGHVRMRCTNTTPVARYATRTATVTARLLKPDGSAPLPTQSSSLLVRVPVNVCEFRTETTSPGSASTSCGDGNARSNNTASTSFTVQVPAFDLQQRATRVLPAGQTSFSFGQPLRYRYRIQNNGPSRAEGVVMTAQLSVPSGFTVGNPQVLNINGSAAETGYQLDTSKTSSVSCNQAGTNQPLVCQLHGTAASNWLDAGREVNFDVEFTQTGSSVVPVTFGNEALVCGADSTPFETSGSCSRTAPNNNNLAAVNDVIFPRTDLAISKTTVTPLPVAINQPVVFDLVLRNNGPQATQRIRVQDVLPPNMELVTTGPNAPSLAVGSGVTSAPSTATGASFSCTATPATLTSAGQSQVVNCVVDAQPGPVGGGAFPGNTGANNTLTLRLAAVPKAGLFTGPYLANLTNTANVQPGLDASGVPLSLDEVPGNNSSSSSLQVATASLAGRVFNDRNGNGLQDGTAATQDEGIGGVTVTLTGTDLFGNAITRSTTTQATVGATRGSYLFSDLPPGSYTLTQTQPTGWLNGSGAPPAPTAGGSYTAAASAGSSTYTGITLALGTAATGYDFPETLPSSVISGSVFVDRNGNGVQDGGEPGIAGVTLGLYPAGTSCPATGTLPANALQTVQTDAAGGYAFASAPPGADYVLCQQQPAGHGDAAPQPATGNTSPGPNAIVVAALPAAGSPGNGFPERLGRIAGTVFVDFTTAGAASNGNGLQEAAEPGLGSATAGAGVPLTLAGTLAGSGTAITPQTTTTAADGSYSFGDLLDGSYTLTRGAVPAPLGSFVGGVITAGGVAPAGTAGSAGPRGDVLIRNIGLPGGSSSTGNNFALLPAAQLAGSVYADVNKDGLRQTAEPGFANQAIELSGTDDTGAAVTLSASTDASGNFVFNGLRPGSYTLTQPQQPPGSSNGATTPGTAGGSATPLATLPSAMGGIVLQPGQQARNYLFGETSDSTDMVVTQVLQPSTFTELNPGTVTLTVGNAGTAPSTGTITVVNTLPPGMALVGTPRGSGWACSSSGQAVTCTSSTPVAPAATASPITLDVTVAANACASWPCTLNNVVVVSGGGEPGNASPSITELGNPPLCTPQPTQNVCRQAATVQQSGGVSGTVWLDVDHDRQLTAADTRLPSFAVELLQNGQIVRTATTDARGDYLITGLVPGSGYEVRFKDPVSGAYYGRPISGDPAGGNDPTASGSARVVAGGSIQNLSIPGGNAVRTNQSLPLDPNGVVYDSATRQPVAGALVELLTPTGDLVPAQCMLGGVNRITTATTGAGVVPGGYAFLLVNPQPAGCGGDGIYQLRVTPPAGYANAGRASDGTLAFTSQAIPAAANQALVPANCVNYVPGGPCTIQAQSGPPTGNQPTPYYFRLPLTPATPAAFVEIVNNHIALDPFGGTRFVITKQAAARSADVGDTMRYTVTVRHVDGPALPNVRVDDTLPAGFRYIPGTFRLGGTLQTDPAGSPGPVLRFPLGTLPVGGQVSFTYFLRVGVGAQQGDGINTAQAVSTSGTVTLLSNVAKAQVRVTGGVFGTEACAVGKVYVDCNHNMVQDREELGIPGVRLWLQDGTAITTDSEGKYSYCGLPPRTHVLKVDQLTLPRGSRLVTSSSRNVDDANSLFLDLKNGELHRADFIEGSCSNTVLEQVKARRTQGEVRAAEREAKGTPALKFEGKAPGYPQQGTDSANQVPVKPRVPASETDPPPPPVQPSRHEQNVPVPQLPAASQNTQRK